MQQSEDRPLSLVPEGWCEGRSAPFDRLIGPFYYPRDRRYQACGFVTDERHANTRGTAHGAMISAAFDLALGNAAYAAAGETPCATVEMAIQYLGAVPLGVFARFETEVLRTTRNLVFARTVLKADNNVVANGQGTLKIVHQR